MEPVVADEGGIHWQLERLRLLYHGYAFSHVDALSHAAFRGQAYNGASDPPRDLARLSVEHLRNGLISRGVLVDLPSLRGVEYLEPGTPYTSADMDAWENMDLDALARECVKANRWTFFFVGAPLPIKEGTGSPLNALAVF